MKPLFNPSLMCMDFLDMRNQAEILNTRCDMYHADVMDGHYVKNITLSPDFIRAFHTVAKKPIDCHLMVTDPDLFLEPLAKAGAAYLCVQAETVNRDAFRIFNKIEALGCKTGVVLNPATPLEFVRHYLDRIDILTIMTVDPGFAGQPFIPEMLRKIREAREFKEKHGCKYKIEVDGSCNERTFKALRDAGAEIFIVGTSGLFSKDRDLKTAWDKMLADFRNATGESV